MERHTIMTIAVVPWKIRENVVDKSEKKVFIIICFLLPSWLSMGWVKMMLIDINKKSVSLYLSLIPRSEAFALPIVVERATQSPRRYV